MPKVSIVLPSLNVAGYIDKCLYSAVNQTLEDIEIICVDAGSTDGTVEIIKKYQIEDSRIKYIHSEKKSYGYQMNLGIEYASGEYVGILETDDTADLDMYEVLYDKAISFKLDYVKADCKACGYGLVNDIHFSTLNEYYNKVLKGNDRNIIFGFWISNWAGIYKRSFLETYNIKHNETLGASYQDTGFLIQVMSYAGRCMHIDKKLYNYTIDNTGSSVKNKEKMMFMKYEHDYVSNILKGSGLVKELKLENYYRFVGHKSTFYRIDDTLKEEYIKVIADDYDLYQDAVKLPYGIGDENALTWAGEIYKNPSKVIYSYYQKKSIFNEVEQCKKIYIYGAGKLLQANLSWLATNAESIYKKIDSIIITKLYDDSPKQIGSFELKSVDKVDIREDDGVIVAVKKGTEAFLNIKKLLAERKVSNVYDIYELIYLG